MCELLRSLASAAFFPCMRLAMSGGASEGSSTGGGDPQLIESHNKTVHKLIPGTKYLLASHSHLFPPSLDTKASSITLPLHLLLPPPLNHNEQYCCQFEVKENGCGSVSVWVGECSVDQKKILTNQSPVSLGNGSLLQLGAHLMLQFMTSSEVLPRRRLLPQTPGQQRTEAPPSKPSRTQPSSVPLTEARGNGDSCSLSLEEGLDPGLRDRLKRIAREVNSRASGVGRSKPPPPYEQVGNSIGYQLFLQRHGNPDSSGGVTATMIDSLYPMLKYMQLKEVSLEQFYIDYLEEYSEARKAGATPTNMHPGDTPTIVFIVDILIQLCSLPRVNEMAQRYCPVWMRLLAVFSHSPSNQVAIATKRLATKVVSCMGLGMMAEQSVFQTHGWSILTTVVDIPTETGSKPALPEPAIALALPLVERQLQHYGNQLPLATAIVGFLARLASTAKQSVSEPSTGQGGGEGGRETVEGGSEEREVYTEQQASRILRLLSEHNILRHVMKVPQPVRRDSTFDSHYCRLVKALVPTRRKLPKSSLTPSSYSSSSLAPPAKPKRIRRTATEGSLRTSRKSRKSRKSIKQITEESSSSVRPVDVGLSRSLSEETLTECGNVEEGEGGEVPVVRSEGEEVESEEEGDVVLVMRSEEEGCVAQNGENGEQDSEQKPSLIPNPNVTPSPSPSPTPLSPDSLAGDIASVLVEVRQPVRQFSLKRNPGQPEVHVPSVPKSPYYRTSQKRRSLQNTPDLEEEESELSGSATDHSSRRSSWLPVSPPVLPLDHTHPLETSTELFSSEIQCGHGDVCTALAGRLELLQGVWSLWKGGRGLQAATNCVRGCFSEDVYDTVLFCDLLHCFLSHKPPWTLGVCVVLLPVIAQLIQSQREANHVRVLTSAVNMIVDRFSSSILACQKKSRSGRLSAVSDQQQKRTCYTALHSMWVAVGDRLVCRGQGDIESGDVITLLSDLKTTLKPFSTKLAEK